MTFYDVNYEANRKLIRETFNIIWAQHRTEVTEMINGIKSLAYLYSYEPIQENSLHVSFSDDLFSVPRGYTLDNIFVRTGNNAKVTGKILFILWYRHLMLINMGFILAAKVCKYIEERTGEITKFQVNNFSGDTAIYGMTSMLPEFLLTTASGQQWDDNINEIVLYQPASETTNLINLYNSSSNPDIDKELNAKWTCACYIPNTGKRGLESNVTIDNLGSYLNTHYCSKIKTKVNEILHI